MNDKYLFLVYSLFLVSSAFMVAILGRLAVLEGGEAGWRALRKNPAFIVNASFALLGAGLIGIAGFRLWDGLHGFPIAGRWPHVLSIFMTMLWIATAGFLWAGTIGRPRHSWRLFLAVSIADVLALGLWLFG